ncbi:hypothetical protein FPK37_22230, partial [Acinetobacter baumannii]|nr:hypothetical protein [Acinetobacter baumannii]
GNGNIFFIIDLLPGYGSNLAEMTCNKLTISGNTINYAGLVTGFYYGVYYMAAGFQVVNDRNTIQIDSNYSNLHLHSVLDIKSGVLIDSLPGFNPRWRFDGKMRKLSV